MADQYDFFSQLPSKDLDALARLLVLPPGEDGEVRVTKKWLDRQDAKIQDLPKTLRLPKNPIKQLAIKINKNLILDGNKVLLCEVHKQLHPYIIHKAFMLLCYETTFRCDRLRGYPHLSERVHSLLGRLDGVASLWLRPEMLAAAYGRPAAGPAAAAHRHRPLDPMCEACALAVVGADGQVLADLRANMLARAKREQPRLLKLVDAWIECFGPATADALMAHSQDMSRVLVHIRREMSTRRERRHNRQHHHHHHHNHHRRHSEQQQQQQQQQQQGRPRARGEARASRRRDGVPAGVRTTEDGYTLPQTRTKSAVTDTRDYVPEMEDVPEEEGPEGHEFAAEPDYYHGHRSAMVARPGPNGRRPASMAEPLSDEEPEDDEDEEEEEEEEMDDGAMEQGLTAWYSQPRLPVPSRTDSASTPSTSKTFSSSSGSSTDVEPLRLQDFDHAALFKAYTNHSQVPLPLNIRKEEAPATAPAMVMALVPTGDADDTRSWVSATVHTIIDEDEAEAEDPHAALLAAPVVPRFPTLYKDSRLELLPRLHENDGGDCCSASATAPRPHSTPATLARTRPTPPGPTRHSNPLFNNYSLDASSSVYSTPAAPEDPVFDRRVFDPRRPPRAASTAASSAVSPTTMTAMQKQQQQQPAAGRHLRLQREALLRLDEQHGGGAGADEVMPDDSISQVDLRRRRRGGA